MKEFYKPMTVQCYIADCLSSVYLELSLLDLHLINKLGLPTLRTELVGCGDLLYYYAYDESQVEQ